MMSRVKPGYFTDFNAFFTCSSEIDIFQDYVCCVRGKLCVEFSMIPWGERMFPSTGSQVLDKLTIQTFKSWRFKPGSVSQVRIPIAYE